MTAIDYPDLVGGFGMNGAQCNNTPFRDEVTSIYRASCSEDWEKGDALEI
jgi:hypothetical protein